MTVLRTERLELRPFSADDADELHGVFADEAVRRYLLDGAVVPRDWVDGEIAASTERFESGSAGLWSIRTYDTIVGFVGYRPFFDPPELQLLYGLLPAARGQGIVTEAATAAIDHGFQLGFTEILAATDTPNAASIRVLERLGFHETRRTDEGEWGTIFFRLAR